MFSKHATDTKKIQGLAANEFETTVLMYKNQETLTKALSFIVMYIKRDSFLYKCNGLFRKRSLAARCNKEVNIHRE
jgi:hypothetical protein